MYVNSQNSIYVWSTCISLQKSGEQPESMTSKDAAMFPIIASCTLLGLYIFFKVSLCVLTCTCSNA